MKLKSLSIVAPCVAMLLAMAGCKSGDKQGDAAQSDGQEVAVVDASGRVQTSADAPGAIEGLPFSPQAVREHVVLDYGKRTIRTDADQSLSFPDKLKDRSKCFLVLSKKDYYLYVYEPQGTDTVLLARYDCAFALKKGDKAADGDMRTPHCTSPSKPFSISEIKDASTWCHDFGDGRGSIKAYGGWFLRLSLDGHAMSGNRSIGIHGSTGNRESVPGRASEGCIRLKDEDIADLHDHYATVGTKVIIKAEDVDDLPFEISAMKRQKIERKRHFNPAELLTNEQVDAAAQPEMGRK